MIGFAIHNSMTTHGGMIPATQMKASQMGNLFLVAGDGHFCPKCKCWSTIVKSHDHVIFDGKAVAYVGNKLTCGATILPKQVHVVGDSKSAFSSSSSQNIANLKSNFLNELQEFNAQFKCVDKETQEVLSNREYFIQLESGQKIYGSTDVNGLTEVVKTKTAEKVVVHFYFVSPSGEIITMEDINI